MAHTSQLTGITPGEPRNEVDETTSDPNKKLGFEISPIRQRWSFIPEYYPDSFTQMKEKELKRYGGKCGNESVSVKQIKNREFHVTGVILEGEINLFHGLLDHEDEVDLLSPLSPAGGMECFIKKAELKGQAGWDPHNRQWMFEYSMDLVSTGRDESDSNSRNAIVSAISGGGLLRGSGSGGSDQ